MPIKDVIKQLLLHRGATQSSVARMAGWKSQAGLATAISRKNPSVHTMLRICDALGFDVVVRERGGDTEWVLSPASYQK